MSEQTEVSVLPQCDLCGANARYDGKTVNGPWANMCQIHFAMLGVGLGTGKGQRLVLRDVANEANTAWIGNQGPKTLGEIAMGEEE